MKLVLAIVHDEDSLKLIDLLTEEKISVTKLASTGGFLRSGNTTLIAGVENERVNDVLSIIERTCKARKHMTTATAAPINTRDGYIPYPIEIVVGGATVFVLDVESFKKF